MAHHRHKLVLYMGQLRPMGIGLGHLRTGHTQHGHQLVYLAVGLYAAIGLADPLVGQQLGGPVVTLSRIYLTHSCKEVIGAAV